MATTKLTLSMEEDLIEKAKITARKQGLSLSKVVKKYLSQFVQNGATVKDDNFPVPEGIKKLRGILKGSKDITKKEMREIRYNYLKEKYGL